MISRLVSTWSPTCSLTPPSLPRRWNANARSSWPASAPKEITCSKVLPWPCAGLCSGSKAMASTRWALNRAPRLFRWQKRAPFTIDSPVPTTACSPSTATFTPPNARLPWRRLSAPGNPALGFRLESPHPHPPLSTRSRASPKPAIRSRRSWLSATSAPQFTMPTGMPWNCCRKPAATSAHACSSASVKSSGSPITSGPKTSSASPPGTSPSTQARPRKRRNWWRRNCWLRRSCCAVKVSPPKNSNAPKPR